MIGTQVIRAQYQSHTGRVCYFAIATIDRVHKNGNVVIAGEQYRPDRDGRSFSRVGRSTGFFNRSFYVLYDDETKAKHAENEAFFGRRARLRTLQEKVANLHDISEERLAILEEAFK